MKYCVYLTTYFGNKLPPFYLGSTSIEKIKKGYRGSVKSAEFASTWRTEDSSLFKTRIISIHSTRELALQKELTLQKLVNAPSNPLYVNKSLACVNGCFGVSKKSHWKGLRGNKVPWYGKRINNTKKISQAKLGSLNPSASEYQVFDSNKNLVFSCVANLIENCVNNGIDKTSAYYLKKSIKTGPLSLIKIGTGPKPKFNSNYLGWFVIKKLRKPHQKCFGNAQLNKKHIFNVLTFERKMLDSNDKLPNGFCYGYPPKLT